MSYKFGDKKEAESNEPKRPPEKVGIGHARKHQKMLEKAKKFWKGGGC